MFTDFIKKYGLSREEFAVFLGVDVKTVHSWCDTNKLTKKDKCRICRTFQISEKELNDYVYR